MTELALSRVAEDRLARALALAYPAELRPEYRTEMARIASERRAGRLRVCLELLSTAARHAPQEHVRIVITDIRHGLRALAKAPGFAAVALIGLALGIGSAITIFSIVSTILVRQLPVGHAERLVYMWTPRPRLPALPRELGPSIADVLLWRSLSHSFSNIAAFQQRMFTLRVQPDSMLVTGALVSGNFFETLKVDPLLGRTLQPADDQPGAACVAVISYPFWKSQFAGDPKVIENTLRLAEGTCQIVGVMPPGFVYPHANDYPTLAPLRRTDVWVPARLT